jgi:hypothetical protein
MMIICLLVILMVIQGSVIGQTMINQTTIPSQHLSAQPLVSPSAQPLVSPSAQPSPSPTNYTWMIVGIGIGSFVLLIIVYKLYNSYSYRENLGPLTNKPCTTIDLDEQAYLL